MSKKSLVFMVLVLIVFPLSSFNTIPEYQTEIHIIDEVTFNNVNDGLELGGPWEAIDVLQKAVDANFPDWAQYIWKDSKGKEHTLMEYVWDISHAQKIGINPRVLLVSIGEYYEWKIPEQKDLLREIANIGVSLKEYYWMYEFDKDVQTQYPEVTGPSSYALYAFFEYDMENVNNWQRTYQMMFGSEAPVISIKAFAVTSSGPFMTKPFNQPEAPTDFYTVYSFLDHDEPYDRDEATLSRFDGQNLSGTFTECDAGKSCYSGHEGYDYTTGRDFPDTKPAIYPVADGVVSSVLELCGQVEIEHEDEEIFTIYMHMEDIEVKKDDPVTTDTLLGLTGNEADPDGKVCTSSGAHLHFHAYASGSSLNIIDPYGWWDVDGDPDPLEDYSSDEKSGSQWLWRGDELGDGYPTVDNRESQAHLFHLPDDYEDGQTWWHDENGYDDESWWTYSVSDDANSTNWAIWGTNIDQSGTYCISAYWPKHEDNTTTARYDIFSESNGHHATVVKDQSTEGDDWVFLDEYDLDSGPSVVILTDFVGTNGTADKRVYFDAIRWEEGSCEIPTPTTQPPPTDTPTPSPPPGTTITVQVDYGNDDAGTAPDICDFLTTKNEVYIGKCDNGSLITSGFRFRDVPIPPGAEIQEAYLEFTVDGTYTLPVVVRITGEDIGDAPVFSVFNKPGDRIHTSAATVWDIPSSVVWEIGDKHRTPEMKAIVQEIVDRSDWASGNSMAYIFRTTSSDQGHRRVVGFERSDNYAGTEHAARLVVTYTESTPPTPTPPTPTPPTPTPPTPTPPTPSPVPTPPTPTPSPKPICFIIDFFNSFFGAVTSDEVVQQITNTYKVASITVSTHLQFAVDMAEFAPLLYQVRDEYLATTEEGQHYIDLFEEHTTEVSHILYDNPDLYQQGYDVIKSFKDHLQALVDGEGDTVLITEEQVSDLEALLDEIALNASPELSSAILTEYQNQPLGEMIGLSMDQAWNHVNEENLTPIISIGGDETLNEGDTLSRNGSFLDPGSTSWTGLVNYGLGDGFIALTLNADNTFTLSQTYPDDGLYTVTVQITDEGGEATGEASFELTVNNLSPIVTLSGDSTLDEGMTFTGGGSFEDPGEDTWGATVDYGDGGGSEALPLIDQTFELEHLFPEDGVYAIEVCVVDDDGGEGCDAVELVVANVAPDVSLSGDLVLDEGRTFTGSGSFADPGADTWSATVDYDDGGGSESLALTDHSFDLEHEYLEDGNYSITVCVVDDDGGEGCNTLELVVDNMVPDVSLSGDSTLDEGMTFTGGGSFADPGADTWSATVDYDDGDGPEPLVLTDYSFDLEHTYLENGNYSITVCVGDDDGGEGCADWLLTVDNLPPSVYAGPDQTTETGQEVVFSGSYSDPGVLDTHIIAWDFGDGDTAEGTLNPTHNYSSPGSYKVTLTVVDDDGDSGSDTLTVEVTQPPGVELIVLKDRRTDNCLTLNLETGDYTWNADNNKAYSGTVDLVERGRIILLRSSTDDNQYLRGILITTREFGYARMMVGKWFWRNWYFIFDQDYTDPLVCP